MRKYMEFFFAVTVLLAVGFSACDSNLSGEENMVTLYIPDTIASFDENDKQVISGSMVFEDGWQSKESFTVRASAQGSKQTVITYGNKSAVTNYNTAMLLSTEMQYNDLGRVIKETTTYKDEYHISKQETVKTYDLYGRILTDTTTIYQPDGTSHETVLSYTYEKTDDGSKGTAILGEGTSYVVTYDHHYRQTCAVFYSNGEESTRVEYRYDSHGNQIGVTIYLQGKQISRNETVYKAVQVTRETAQRLPQFRSED